MISTYETIQLEIKDDTAYLHFNRPDSLNALNTEMISELADLLKAITMNDDIKILVVSGNGRAFSAGGDIKEMLAMEEEKGFASFMDQINEAVSILTGMPKLTIAAINGPAAGLGLSLALACDYIMSDMDSKIAMNFIGIGLVPDGGGHYLLQRRIGQNKAKKLIWEGKVMAAEEAAELGIIDEAVPQLELAVERKIAEWKKKPILAMIKTKKIYTELNRPDFNKSLELEKHGQWKMRQTKDHLEGIRAFVEKRTPQFTGE
ncbi:enoyl-CoA hydratase [Weizmannia acidilactici]|uniref:enoyl-CoA hydratase n=1 Tax=Weizmannia acidilactici TaxID=2607726 RepID=UPI00124F5D06|nr:enoyl-CoA hydratase [Weizmannia acidilactici]GER65818.1 enoyl-CoA hydratase [Weizmannia acidilactici]